MMNIDTVLLYINDFSYVGDQDFTEFTFLSTAVHYCSDTQFLAGMYIYIPPTITSTIINIVKLMISVFVVFSFVCTVLFL